MEINTFLFNRFKVFYGLEYLNTIMLPSRGVVDWVIDYARITKYFFGREDAIIPLSKFEKYSNQFETDNKEFNGFLGSGVEIVRSETVEMFIDIISYIILTNFKYYDSSRHLPYEFRHLIKFVSDLSHIIEIFKYENVLMYKLLVNRLCVSINIPNTFIDYDELMKYGTKEFDKYTRLRKRCEKERKKEFKECMKMQDMINHTEYSYELPYMITLDSWINFLCKLYDSHYKKSEQKSGPNIYPARNKHTVENILSVLNKNIRSVEKIFPLSDLNIRAIDDYVFVNLKYNLKYTAT